MKANHNSTSSNTSEIAAVSNGSKILKWKQITTICFTYIRITCCFQWFKDTKMKANHNNVMEKYYLCSAVSNGSKILKWKQITTKLTYWKSVDGCFQWFKDTKMKANHNIVVTHLCSIQAVSNGSKILKWKQITTLFCEFWIAEELFPMVQRY